jgi:cell division protein FtsN
VCEVSRTAGALVTARPLVSLQRPPSHGRRASSIQPHLLPQRFIEVINKQNALRAKPQPSLTCWEPGWQPPVNCNRVASTSQQSAARQPSPPTAPSSPLTPAHTPHAHSRRNPTAAAPAFVCKVSKHTQWPARCVWSASLS